MMLNRCSVTEGRRNKSHFRGPFVTWARQSNSEGFNFRFLEGTFIKSDA